MVYRGHVENGVIHVDDPVELPEGTAVRFELAPDQEQPEEAGASFSERFAEVMGKARTLSADAAENHDRNLYGTPEG